MNQGCAPLIFGTKGQGIMILTTENHFQTIMLGEFEFVAAGFFVPLVSAGGFSSLQNAESQI